MNLLAYISGKAGLIIAKPLRGIQPYLCLTILVARANACTDRRWSHQRPAFSHSWYIAGNYLVLICSALPQPVAIGLHWLV